VAILVQNMERLDENNKEESDGVHNTLGIDISALLMYAVEYVFTGN
jgi:antitoxin component of RelBE/YafQ-DinJ toxin-antitoxin module